MISVKEAFAMCNIEKLTQEYRKTVLDESDIKDECEKFKEWYKNILHMNPCLYNGKILLPYISLDLHLGELNYCMDVSYIMEGCVKTPVIIPTGMHDLERKKLGELQELCRSIKMPELYAFEFCEWSEILGFKISENVLNQLGLENVMASVADEMTFFGFDESYIKKEKTELEHAISECESGMDSFKPFSVQDAMKMFGLEKIEKTREEREKDDILLYKCQCIRKRNAARYINIVCREIREEENSVSSYNNRRLNYG